MNSFARRSELRAASVALALALSLAPRAAAAPVTAPGAGATALVHVNILPMDSDRALLDQTLLFREGRIGEIQPSKSFKVPRGATVVECGGRWLVPGLYDCSARVDDASLPLFVSYGVTAVRATSPGRTSLLALRDAVAAGERTGPRLFVVAPALGGEGDRDADPVESPLEARTAVAEARALGFDGLALGAHVAPLVHATVADASQQLGVALSGAVPERVAPSRALASGQRTREGLAPEVSLESGELAVADPKARAAAIAASGAWIVPELARHRARASRASLDSLLAADAVRALPARTRTRWARTYGAEAARPDYAGRGAWTFVKQLESAGARLVAGSGAGAPFVAPGVSLLDELDALVACGFTPWRALRAATRDAAECLGDLATSGTIEPNKRADFLLLDSDPRLGLAALRKPSGLFLGGRFLPADSLRARRAPASDAPRKRFAPLEPLAVSNGYRYARYELSDGASVIGEERLLLGPSPEGLRQLRAQCDVDGPEATVTELRADFGIDGRGTRVRLTRDAGGSRWTLDATRPDAALSALHVWDPAAVTLRGALPRVGEVAFTLPLAEGATLGTPDVSADVAFPMVANFQLLLDRADRLTRGASVLLPFARVVADDECWGARRVWRESVARIERLEDVRLQTVEGEQDGRSYRVELAADRDGSPRALVVSVGPDGLVHEVRDPALGLVATRVR